MITSLLLAVSTPFPWVSPKTGCRYMVIEMWDGKLLAQHIEGSLDKKRIVLKRKARK